MTLIARRTYCHLIPLQKGEGEYGTEHLTSLKRRKDRRVTKKYCNYNSPSEFSKRFCLPKTVCLLDHTYNMEEFTGDEASQSNQIFVDEATSSNTASAGAAPSIPSYAPDSHVPGSEVRDQ